MSAGAKREPVLAACDQLVRTQSEVAGLASRTDQIQELINWMKQDMQQPCNLTTHHDSRSHHLLSYTEHAWSITCCRTQNMHCNICMFGAPAYDNVADRHTFAYCGSYDKRAEV